MLNIKDNFKQLFQLFVSRKLFLTLLFVAISQGAYAAEDELTIQDLSVSDISVLWPVPTNEAEIGNLLNATTVVGNSTIWPQDSFDAVLKMATTKVVARDSFNNTHKIGITGDLLNQRETWKVVGFRVDPSAPSTDPAVISSFGSIPQIRLIMQPVTIKGGHVTVHDYAVHLPFNYVLNSVPPFKPDVDTFTEILNDVLELKNYLLQSPEKLSTDGELRVSPGLSNNVAGFSEKIEAFLGKYLSPKKLTIVSFMGIPAKLPEPWMFFEMTVFPSVQAKAAPAQILFFLDSFRKAGPAIPGLPLHGVKGNLGDVSVNTAALFQKTGASLNAPAIPGRESPKFNEIPNIIANPSHSNVLNTDCVSCHSETTRRTILKIGDITGFKFANDSGVDQELLPTDEYNTRNFGWFSLSPEVVAAKPHITWRTANESAGVLKYIKKHY